MYCNDTGYIKTRPCPYVLKNMLLISFSACCNSQTSVSITLASVSITLMLALYVNASDTMTTTPTRNNKK